MKRTCAVLVGGMVGCTLVAFCMLYTPHFELDMRDSCSEYNGSGELPADRATLPVSQNGFGASGSLIGRVPVAIPWFLDGLYRELLNEPDSSIAWDLAESFLAKWAMTDPLAALKWIDSQEDFVIQKERCRIIVMEGWAQNNPQQAIEWFFGQSGTKNALSLSHGLIRGVITHVPELALDLLSRLPESSLRSETVALIGKRLVLTHGGEAASRYVDGLFDEQLSYECMMSVASVWAQADSSAAIAWYMSKTSGLTKEEQVSSQHMLARRWAESDPAGAADWLIDLPRTPQWSTTARRLVSLWFEQDEEAVGEWLMEHVDEPELQPAQAVYALIGFSHDADAALTWLNGIDDKQLRETTYALALALWMDRDPDAVDKFISEHY